MKKPDTQLLIEIKNYLSSEIDKHMKFSKTIISNRGRGSYRDDYVHPAKRFLAKIEEIEKELQDDI